MKLESNKQIISDASEIYPNCSRQFACGVHNWINKGDNYDQRMLSYESKDFKKGFYQAQDDLKNNYKMER